ncbi:MAG: FAD-dependent monooxygenase, partial [Acidimicrobiaceae bacterium]|nr:FAD-dependent monooxygenase [Acidimicrobiaceae bacterium]
GITLARYGIRVSVIDRRAGVSQLSRSLVISTRGMELMRRFGLEDPIRSGACDVKIRAWVTASLASSQGTEMPLGHPSDAEAAVASPTRAVWAGQDHLEPILLEHLRSLPTATARFGYELRELAQDDHGLTVSLVDTESRTVEHVRPAYLIAADGAHSTVRGRLGISMIGPDDVAHYERVEFTAPLWDMVGERRYGLYLITEPGVAGIFAPRGHGDRWGLSRETPVGAPGLLDLSHDDLIALIQRAAGTEALRPKIEGLSTFRFAAQMAERYADRRCFLVGDAAHRMTPRGGTGMNTAIQDSFDLGWKLAWVLRGWAGPELLATYESERRPVAAHNVQRSSEPTGARRETHEALPWDLNGRLPHHWVSTCETTCSTLDLIGDGLTVLAGPEDPRWLHFAEATRSNVPVDVHVLDDAAARQLDLRPDGALLARPDGRELRRWLDFDTATVGGSSSAFQLISDGQSPTASVSESPNCRTLRLRSGSATGHFVHLVDSRRFATRLLAFVEHCNRVN